MDTSSDSKRLLGRQRPLHAVLGGGKVADVLLWRERRISAAILIGIAAIWYLLEVVGYTLVTLLCHIFITTMLLMFIWSHAAEHFNRNPPNIPKIILQYSTSRELASNLCVLYVACVYNPKSFFLTIISLWIISVIGSSISTLNLLFLGLVCLQTLPFIYEQYEDEVDHFAYEIIMWIKKMYNKFEAEIMTKITRGPVKDKKN